MDEQRSAGRALACVDKIDPTVCTAKKKEGRCGHHKTRQECTETCQLCGKVVKRGDKLHDAANKQAWRKDASVKNPCGVGKAVKDSMKGLHPGQQFAIPVPAQFEEGLYFSHNVSNMVYLMAVGVHDLPDKQSSLKAARDELRSIMKIANSTIRRIDAVFNNEPRPTLGESQWSWHIATHAAYVWPRWSSSAHDRKADALLDFHLHSFLEHQRNLKTASDALALDDDVDDDLALTQPQSDDNDGVVTLDP